MPNKTYDKVQLRVKFTQASDRANIGNSDTNGENIAISFGKLSKWYEALVPTGGSSGKILTWNTAGTAKWSDPLHPTITKSADTTSKASPAHSETFTTVDTVTRDTYGHVTKINTKTVTLPAGYLHPTHTAYPLGLYKITVDGLGHVSAATAATKADIPALDYLPNTTKYALSDSVGGSAKTADKLTTARTIAIGTGVTSTATSFDGSANITIPVTGIKEAYLTWGGKDFAGSYGPIDAAIQPRLGANRMEFLKAAGITIERTTDGGTSWTVVDVSATAKTGLFTVPGTTTKVSATSTAKTGTAAANNMMRVTVATGAASIYTVLNKFIIYMSTSGCSGCYVKIRIRLESNRSAGNDTWKIWNKSSKTWVATTDASATEANTRVDITGWSGFNVINVSGVTTYGNQAASQYGNVQFIFGCASNSSTSAGMEIYSIQGYGGVGWTTPSKMAQTGHLYSYDASQNATFPAALTATNFNGKLNTMTISGTNDGSYNLNNFLVTNDITVGDTNGRIKVKTTNLTIYTHPSYTAKTSGLYKITVDSTGHISGTASVSPSDIPDLNYVPNTQAGVIDAINLLSTGSSTPGLADYYVSQYVNGGTTSTSYHRRPISSLWNAFKELITLTTTGSGNAVTGVSIENDGDHNRKIAVTKGSTFSLSTHTHGLLHSNLNQTATNGTTGGWSVIGIDPAVTGYVLKSIRVNTTSPDWLSGDYGAGIAFGGSDTKGVISMSYQSPPVITFAGGNHNSSKTEPTWYLKISGTSGSTYNLANFYDSTISRTANTVLAAPNGSNGEATFRKLVAADLTGINYAGSSSAGGAATSANKLNTDEGGTYLPVYFNNGVPEAVTVKNNTSKGTIGWTSGAAANAALVTVNSIAYWNGAYSGTSSNLAYCNKGEFGSIVTKSTTDYSKVSFSQNLTSGTKVGKITIDGTSTDLYCETNTNTTYSAGTGLSLSGTTFNHSNSVTSVANYNKPYVKYDAQGHITGSSYWTATAVGTGGKGGWIKVATMVHTDIHDDTPIMLLVSQRGSTITYKLHIVWKNTSNTDPDINKFKLSSDIDTNADAYIKKSTTSTWELYIKKLDTWDAIAMHLYVGKYFPDHMTWTWQDVQTAESAITGGIKAEKIVLYGHLDRAFIYDDKAVPSGHTWAEYAWHKFAEVTITDAWADCVITFLVSRTFGDSAENAGILSAKLRTNGSKAYDSAQLKWLVRNSGLSKDDFVMVYTSTSGTSTKAELWCRIPTQHSGLIFTVLKEHRRHYSTDASWTLVKTPDATGSTHGSSSYPTTGIPIISSDGTITNSTTGNAATATTATYVNGTLTNPTDPIEYSVPFHTDPTTGSKSLLNNDGISYVCREGTADNLGFGVLVLGNGVNSGTAGNKYGIVRMYPQTGKYYGQIQPVTTLTGSRTYQLPNASGNVILGTKGSTSFWGLMDGAGSISEWIRATSSGFIPSQGAKFFQTATSSLGTNTWYFKNSYIQYMNANSLILGAAKTADGAAKGQVKFFSGNLNDATGTVTLECINDSTRTGDYTVKLPTWNGTIPVFEKLFEGALQSVSLSYSDINEYDLFLITVANSNATSEQVTVTSLWVSNIAGVHDMPLIWGGAPTSSGGACNVTSGWIQLSKSSGTITFNIGHKSNVAQMTSSGWSISSPTYNLYIRKIFGLKTYKRT